MTSPALSEQLDYYRARAAEYDEWWLRLGRYDRGPELNAGWFAEIEKLAAALERFGPEGRILELAGGTGIWSERLLGHADALTVVDGSSEMLAINAARLHSQRVEYLHEDLFDWQPDEQFDTVFFSFWLSHVPDSEFDRFWTLVRSCLEPGGRVFFIDSRRRSTSTARDQTTPVEADRMERRLNDGRKFNVYKIYYAPRDLEHRLASLGWNAEIAETDEYFIYGSVK